MFGRWRFHTGRPAFAWGGGYGPETEEGWQPWARPEHPPFGPPWARHEPHHHFGPPWARHEPHHHFGPPWARHEPHHFGPPFGGWGIWRMSRHFPFGPGGRGPMGPRFMGRGDLKYVLLGLLRERPMHGYEMMKQLEEQASGFYTPSAGAIYPTLQLLEDRGWVTSQTVDGKKIYTITDAGRQELEAQSQRAEAFGGGPFGWGGHHGRGGPFGRQAQPELEALRREGMEVARLMWASVMASGGDPEKLAKLRAIIEKTRSNLQEFLGQAQSSASGGTSAPTSGTVEDA
jgi:DNA-binding PadR family transcriptional regulator